MELEKNMKRKKILGAFCLAIGFCLCFFAQPALAQPALAQQSSETEEDSVIQPLRLKTSDLSLPETLSHTVLISAGEKEQVKKVQMDYEGQLKLHVSGQSVPKAVTLELYRDKACTDKVGSSSFLSTSDKKMEWMSSTITEGLYYIKFSLYSSGDTDTVLSLCAYGYAEEDPFLLENKWTKAYSVDNNLMVYHEIKTEKMGYIKVEGRMGSESGLPSSISLCNENQKVISDTAYLTEKNSCSAYFAVKKGSYFIGSKGRGAYELRYTFYPVTENSGSAKGKAAALKQGRKITGAVYCEDKKTKYDWYQVNLKKKQKLAMTISARTNKNLTIKLIPKDENTKLSVDTWKVQADNGKKITTKETIPQGIYYIQVGKTEEKGSGYYEITLSK